MNDDANYYRENDVCYDEDRGFLMDNVDYQPDVLDREAKAREKMTQPQMPQRPSAEVEALSQKLMTEISENVSLRTQLIEAKRLLEAEIAP
jgi:hypothetical protein